MCVCVCIARIRHVNYITINNVHIEEHANIQSTEEHAYVNSANVRRPCQRIMSRSPPSLWIFFERLLKYILHACVELPAAGARWWHTRVSAGVCGPQAQGCGVWWRQHSYWWWVTLSRAHWLGNALLPSCWSVACARAESSDPACPKWTLNNTPLCALDLLIYIHFHLFKYCTYSALEYLAGLRLYPDLIINNVVPLNCIDSGLKVAFMNESIFN